MSKDPVGKYASVNGLKMYYEIHGTGAPVVLIHGGGSTIQTSFSRVIPELAKTRQVIAVELQAHGRTSDRDKALSFEQDADDVAELLNILKIKRADFLGFSNGGQTAIEIALRHPVLVNKLILCSIFYSRSGAFTGFWEGFESVVDFSNMPQGLKDEFLKVNNDPAVLLNMFNRDVQRMKTFKGWTAEQIKTINAPTLIFNGNNDVGTAEHAVEMYRLFPDAQLSILPGSHGAYLGEITTGMEHSKIPELTVAMINEFLNEAVSK